MKLTIREYMEKYGIKSKQTVYNKIKSGEIKKVKVGTRMFILVKDNEPNKDQELHSDIQELLSGMKRDEEQAEAYIKELKEQIKDLRADRDNLNERLREANILNLNNVEAIKSFAKLLITKNEIIEQLEKQPKGLSWLSKLFKKDETEKE